MSTPARLLDQYGQPMGVQNGAAVRSRAGALLSAGPDENAVARVRLVESKFNATVRAPLGMYADRFSPINVGQIGASRPSAINSDNNTSSISRNNNFTTNGVNRVSLPQLFVVSTSANDIAVGTGIQQLTLVYWSVDGKRNVQQVSMNGIAPVTVNCVPNVFFIDRLFASAVGSGGAAAGTITVADDILGTHTQVQMAVGETAIGQRFVVSNNTFYITSVMVEPSASVIEIRTLDFQVVQYNYKTTNIDITKRVRLELGTNIGGSSGVYSPFNPPIEITRPDADSINAVSQSVGTSGTVVFTVFEPFL